WARVSEARARRARRKRTRRVSRHQGQAARENAMTPRGFVVVVLLASAAGHNLLAQAPAISSVRELLQTARRQSERGDAAGRLEPERPLTLAALGLAQNGRKQYDDAKRALRHAVELEPDNIDALAALGEAEVGTNDLDAAEDHARRVLGRSSAQPTASLVI